MFSIGVVGLWGTIGGLMCVCGGYFVLLVLWSGFVCVLMEQMILMFELVIALLSIGFASGDGKLNGMKFGGL